MPPRFVFARNPECPQTQKLIKALDEATQKNTKAEMGSYAVFLTGDSTAEAKLKKVAEENKLKALVLSIESPEGPSKYNINKDADVTVLLYTDFVVKANHTFAKGKITDKDIETIVADVAKILPTN